MARVNISMPDDVYRRARRAGLDVSQLAQGAVRTELGRLAKIAASNWADRVLGEDLRRDSA